MRITVENRGFPTVPDSRSQASPWGRQLWTGPAADGLRNCSERPERRLRLFGLDGPCGAGPAGLGRERREPGERLVHALPSPGRDLQDLQSWPDLLDVSECAVHLRTAPRPGGDAA